MTTTRAVTAAQPEGVEGAAHTPDRDGGLRVWPLRKPALAVLAKGGAALLAIWSIVGLLYMELLDDGPVGDGDRAMAEWLEDRRTPRWNSLSLAGSMLSETLVKVALVAIVGGIMVAAWRRWHDGVYLAAVIIFEATVFVLASFIVGRDRPPVEYLDEPAPSGSFPSGHAAAAVAFYTSLFVIARWHTRNRFVLTLLGIIGVLAPIIVATSRVYRGMHHPIDVVAGVLLGVASIMVVRAAMRAGVADIAREAQTRPMPAHVRQLDLTPDSCCPGWRMPPQRHSEP